MINYVLGFIIFATLIAIVILLMVIPVVKEYEHMAAEEYQLHMTDHVKQMLKRHLEDVVKYIDGGRECPICHGKNIIEHPNLDRAHLVGCWGRSARDLYHALIDHTPNVMDYHSCLVCGFSFRGDQCPECKTKMSDILSAKYASMMPDPSERDVSLPIEKKD